MPIISSSPIDHEQCPIRQAEYGYKLQIFMQPFICAGSLRCPDPYLFQYNQIAATLEMDTFGEGNYTAFSYNEEGQSAAKTSDLYGRARANFIKKVYLVLTMQIAVTVFFSALSMTSHAFFMYQVANMWLFYVALVTAIFIQLYMFCCQGGRTSPSNVICVGLFTLAESYIVSFICSITGKQSGNSVVVLAAVYTLVIVVACTIYAAYTESDFTTSYGIIIVLTAAMLVLFIVTLFTSSPFIHNLYCCIGVVLFGIYLIIDTQMIMGGRTVELAVDEYFLAAMLLYIDVIQIFLYILELLGSNKD